MQLSRGSGRDERGVELEQAVDERERALDQREI